MGICRSLVRSEEALYRVYEPGGRFTKRREVEHQRESNGRRLLVFTSERAISGEVPDKTRRTLCFSHSQSHSTDMISAHKQPVACPKNGLFGDWRVE